MIKKCVILARISSEKQDRELSLPAQITRLSEYAARHGLEILRQDVITESSTNGDRKKFMNCLKFCVANRAALLFDCIDRAQRSFTEIPILEKYRRDGKLELHFVRENIVINAESSSTELLMWHQGVLMAESYSLHFKENVKRSVNMKISRGEYPSMAPIGYINHRSADNKSVIAIDPNKADKVRMLFMEYARGQKSLKELRDYSEQIGLYGRRKNKPLTLSIMQKILDNPFYCGTAKWGNQTFEHCHPRLISRELWETCQRVMHGRNQHNYTKWGEKDYLYRGLFRDYYTKRIITTEKKKGKYLYLMAWNADGRHISIPQDAITGQIYKILKSLEIPREFAVDVAEYLKSAKTIELEYNQRIEKELIAEQEKWHARINKLNDMWLDGKIETDEYNEQKTRLTDEYNRARAKQDAHTQSDWDVNNDIVHIFNSLTNIGDIFLKSSEDAKKREMLKTIFRTLIIKDGNICFDLNFPFSECAKIAQSNNWRGGIDNFRTEYRQQIRELNAANWNWVLPLAA